MRRRASPETLLKDLSVFLQLSSSSIINNISRSSILNHNLQTKHQTTKQQPNQQSTCLESSKPQRTLPTTSLSPFSRPVQPPPRRPTSKLPRTAMLPWAPVPVLPRMPSETSSTSRSTPLPLMSTRRLLSTKCILPSTYCTTV